MDISLRSVRLTDIRIGPSNEYLIAPQVQEPCTDVPPEAVPFAVVPFESTISGNFGSGLSCLTKLYELDQKPDTAMAESYIFRLRARCAQMIILGPWRPKMDLDAFSLTPH